MFRKSFGFICCFFLVCHATFAATLPDISADGAILIETNTNTVIYAKNADLPFYPASTTKILTSLAIVNDLPMDQIVTKSQDAVNNVPSDSSQIGLSVGTQYSVYDGLHAVLMSSDNFVCHDLALADAGSIEAFASKMNQLAFENGANYFHFVNPHGYHDDNHYVSPYSLSQIALGAFSNPIVKEIAGTLNYDFHVQNTGKTIKLKHTASLLDPESEYYNSHVIAAKTGYHTPAARTLVARATYKNIDLIGVVMRTDAPLQFEDMNKLFSYGSDYFSLNTDTENNSYIVNTTYSSWAKPYVEQALANRWITPITQNYTSPITKDDFLEILKINGTTENQSIVDTMIEANNETYSSRPYLSRSEVAKIIYDFLSPYELSIIPSNNTATDINKLSDSIKEAILFCSQAGIINLKEGNQFLPNDHVSYEEAVCLIDKVDHIINRYEHFTL